MGAVIEDDVYIVLRMLAGDDRHVAHVHDAGSVAVEAPDFAVGLRHGNSQCNL